MAAKRRMTWTLPRSLVVELRGLEPLTPTLPGRSQLCHDVSSTAYRSRDLRGLRVRGDAG